MMPNKSIVVRFTKIIDYYSNMTLIMYVGQDLLEIEKEVIFT